MKKPEEILDEELSDEVATGKTDGKPDISVDEQVRREFEYAADRGEPEIEQIENELSEPDYMLPSPENSREDAAFTNINADQRGRAFGVANQRNEPLDILDKVEDRDEDRWALNPASADSKKA